MNTFFTTLILAILTLQLSAQKAFEKKDITLNLGIGISMDDANLLSEVGVLEPSILASFDIGVHDYVSVGAFFGGLFYREPADAFYEEFKERTLDFGGKASFHWWALAGDKAEGKNLKNDAIDLYISLLLGLEITGGSEGEYSFPKENNFRFGIVQGMRFYPKSNEHFAFLMEFGLGPISHVLLGTAFKF